MQTWYTTNRRSSLFKWKSALRNNNFTFQRKLRYYRRRGLPVATNVTSLNEGVACEVTSIPKKFLAHTRHPNEWPTTDTILRRLLILCLACHVMQRHSRNTDYWCWPYLQMISGSADMIKSPFPRKKYPNPIQPIYTFQENNGQEKMRRTLGRKSVAYSSNDNSVEIPYCELLKWIEKNYNSFNNFSRYFPCVNIRRLHHFRSYSVFSSVA